MMRMKRLGLSLALLAALGGCGVFKGGKENKPKTAVLGERIPVLTSETGADVDPGLADTPVVVPPAAPNDRWTQPGGNAQKSMGHLALSQSLSRVWEASIPGTSKKERLAAAPVVADGKLFAMDTAGTVHAFDANTGAKLWTRQVLTKGGKAGKKSRGALFGGGVSWDDGRLYATNGVGDAAALDATTGNVIWQKRPGGPLRGAPTVANGSVYVVSQDNQIFALKAETGETIWNEAGTLQLAGVFGVAAPAVAQGTVIAGFSSGELNAYRYENGRIVWQDALSKTSITTSVSTLSDIDADPVIYEGRVYAVGQGGRMVAMEIVTGQRQWELNIAGIATPWVAGDWLFVVTDEAKLLCVSRGTGKIRWMSQLKRYHKAKKQDEPLNWVGPILAGDRLILANNDGELVNINVADGKQISAMKIGEPVALAPIVANSMLYVLDGKGRITAWK
jgi:outer membrane protein assembly factor BamB